MHAYVKFKSSGTVVLTGWSKYNITVASFEEKRTAPLLDIWILYSLKIIYKLDGDGLSHMGIRMQVHKNYSTNFNYL